MKLEQDRGLYDIDWDYRYIAAARPDYVRLFNVLDEAGVTCAADIGPIIEHRLKEHIWTANPLRSIMSETVQQAVAWLNRPMSDSSPAQVRIIADAPDSQLLFLASLLTDDAVILSDSSVHLWSTELVNPIHAVYWDGLLDQMLLCREPLVEGHMVLCPAIVHRTVGRGKHIEGAYTLDFTSSLSYPDETFLRSKPTSPPSRAPEDLARAAELKPEVPPTAVPLLRLDLPIVRGVPVATLRKLFEQEPEALQRLRFVSKVMRSCTGDKLLAGNGLQDVADRLEYEIVQVQIEYERLLRSREQLLATAGLGVLGLMLSVSLPPNLAPLAGALGGGAAGVNSLKYVFAVRESNAELRARDYYLAWRAWRQTK
jgi:hypothetical protein